MPAGFCNDCGAFVRNGGHAKSCRRGVCSRCGGRFSRLADNRLRLCRDCAAVEADRLPSHWRDDPNKRGGAALICYRQERQTSQISYWKDFSAALEADAQSTCGQDCEQDHGVVYRDDDGQLRTIQLRRSDVGDVRREIRAAMRGDGLALARLRNTLESQGDQSD